MKVAKMTPEELSKAKLKDIIAVIKEEMTEEEVEQCKTESEGKKRREFITSLYDKYIDTVIAKSSNETPAPVENNEPDQETEVKEGSEPGLVDIPSTEPVEPPQAPAAPVETPKVKETAELNTNISFTATIRGVGGHNGTKCMMCEQLLIIAFRNPNASISFKTPERAKQFISIVKHVKSVKGIANISEEDRTRVCTRVAAVNGL